MTGADIAMVTYFAVGLVSNVLFVAQMRRDPTIQDDWSIWLFTLNVVTMFAWPLLLPWTVRDEWRRWRGTLPRWTVRRVEGLWRVSDPDGHPRKTFTDHIDAVTWANRSAHRDRY